MSDKSEFTNFKNKVKNLSKGDCKKNLNDFCDYLREVKSINEWKDFEIETTSERINRLVYMLKFENSRVIEEQYIFHKALSLNKYRYINLLLDEKFNEIFNPPKTNERDAWCAFKVKVMKVLNIGLVESAKIGSILKKEKDMDKWKDEEILSRYESIKIEIKNAEDKVKTNEKIDEKLTKIEKPKKEDKEKSIKISEKVDKTPKIETKTPKPKNDNKTPKSENKESESNSDSEDSNNDSKSIYKKRQIPKYIRSLVWNRWVGGDKAIAKCMCCQETQVSIMSFHCGHVLAEKEGGNSSIDNLRVCCSHCNLAMGTMNMKKFVKTYFNREIE